MDNRRIKKGKGMDGKKLIREEEWMGTRMNGLI